MSFPSADIFCASIPISFGSDCPKIGLFARRFSEQSIDSIDHASIPSCWKHNNVVASMQCIDCVRKGLQVRYSYHCSKKCFLEAWKEHSFYHCQANVGNKSHKDTEGLGKLNRCNSWPPGDMVSLFDEKLELVMPTGSDWVGSKDLSNVLIPYADGVGVSFKLESVIPHHLPEAMCAKQVFVSDFTIQRNLLPRSIKYLPDLKESEKFGLTKKFSKIGSFNVLTYNILSQSCASEDIYWYCPQWALTWEYRRKNLLHELILYKADILCLQEVQSDHFEDFFKPQLEAFGYSVVYKRKVNGVYTPNGDKFDGCATFFRNDKFKKIISYELEYSKSALSLMKKLEPSLIEEARKRLLKDNVAIIVILEMVENAVESATSFSRLCVVNTHICADKSFPDVKLFQVSDLISEIEKIIDQRMPLFICGDINSLPGSDPYILLTKHEVNPACTEATDPLRIYQHLKLHHSMKLASAYVSAFPKPVNNIEGHKMTVMHPETREPLFTHLTARRREMHGKTGEPFFTHLTPRRREMDSITGEHLFNHLKLSRGSTLDYIFYTEDSVEVEGLLELPDQKSVGSALPSPLLSSDHIALMGRFRITRPFQARQIVARCT